ncbi:MAG: hypothetical protein ACI90R_002110, partial [Alteromonas macleodii]
YQFCYLLKKKRAKATITTINRVAEAECIKSSINAMNAIN